MLTYALTIPADEKSARADPKTTVHASRPPSGTYSSYAGGGCASAASSTVAVGESESFVTGPTAADSSPFFSESCFSLTLSDISTQWPRSGPGRLETELRRRKMVPRTDPGKERLEVCTVPACQGGLGLKMKTGVELEYKPERAPAYRTNYPWRAPFRRCSACVYHLWT